MKVTLMTQDTEVQQLSPTVGEAFKTYLDSLKPEQRDTDAAYVRHFVQYWQEDYRFGDMTGSRVESYVEQTIKPTDPRATDRVQALKRWFQFARKKGYTKDNFGLHVRVRKSPGRVAAADRKTLEDATIEMTAVGLADMQEELASLKSETPELVAAVALAREDKDFRENAPLDAAREALAYHEGRIKDIEASLKYAVVSEHKSEDASAVGSTVIVKRADTGATNTYKLVSKNEANAREQRISVDSPVGRQLLGRRPGDEVVVDAPSGAIHLLIESVNH